MQHEHATRIIRILDSVVGEKSNLYFLTEAFFGDMGQSGEGANKIEVPLGSGDIHAGIGLAEAKKTLEAREANLGRTPALLQEHKQFMVKKIQGRAEDLSGLSGQFRAAVAVFKAQTQFI